MRLGHGFRADFNTGRYRLRLLIEVGPEGWNGGIYDMDSSQRGGRHWLIEPKHYPDSETAKSEVIAAARYYTKDEMLQVEWEEYPQMQYPG